MFDRLLEIIAGVRDFVLPDLDVTKDKARKALFQMLKSISAETMAEAIKTLPTDVMKNIINVEFAGKKARERDYMLAQLMVTLIRISDHQEPYKMQMHHPRRKVVSIIELLVKANEKFDWTKAAKNGFTIQPAKAAKKTTEAVDYFTGETMLSLSRRLKGYGIKPAAYKKLFQSSDATFVDTEYSEKQRQGNKSGQIKNAPRQRGTKLTTEETKIVKYIQDAKEVFASIETTLPHSRLLAGVLASVKQSPASGMTAKDATKNLKIITKIHNAVIDIRFSKANRTNISKALAWIAKAQEQFKAIGERAPQTKLEKAEASVIMARLDLLSGG